MNDLLPENGSYEEHARNCAADDLWGQVRRTVNGKPLPKAQIDMIVEQVASLLALGPEDQLLDLCCGNGALSARWFERCAGGLGVDASSFLIDVARQRFSDPGRVQFVEHEALSFVLTFEPVEHITKALCYGSLQYFSPARATRLLAALNARFPELERVVIGNLPDLEHVHAYFGDDMPTSDVLASPSSTLGVWYSRDDFCALARAAGWHCTIHGMPRAFHAAHYRFDVNLFRDKTQ